MEQMSFRLTSDGFLGGVLSSYVLYSYTHTASTCIGFPFKGMLFLAIV